MMNRNMMIDYINMDGKMVRKQIDDAEFCIRDGKCVFTSGGKYIEIEIDEIFQVYMA